MQGEIGARVRSEMRVFRWFSDSFSELLNSFWTGIIFPASLEHALSIRASPDFRVSLCSETDRDQVSNIHKNNEKLKHLKLSLDAENEAWEWPQWIQRRRNDISRNET